MKFWRMEPRIMGKRLFTFWVRYYKQGEFPKSAPNHGKRISFLIGGNHGYAELSNLGVTHTQWAGH